MLNWPDGNACHYFSSSPVISALPALSAARLCGTIYFQGTIGDDMIRLKVNGVDMTFDGDPSMPLLWYLRDVASLAGTKYGCGIALCGACTVHVNGKAARSCSLPMQSLNGTSITTIEGISSKGLHPVQKAWMEIKVPQCGYCQTGQIMSAIALLKDNHSPSDKDIDEAMGNICRCGTYQRIRAAIHQAAKEMA
jgi:isoquinoline 1-oxidoreductase alpha subunit